MDAPLDSLKYDAAGLVPIIVQDIANGQVLMMAWANRQALELTLQTGKVHTYSRRRGRIAQKGESSRHFQHVREFWTDCDNDVVLVKVDQDVAACHEGYRSCFYKKYDPGAEAWKTVGQRVFDPNTVYNK